MRHTLTLSAFAAVALAGAASGAVLNANPGPANNGLSTANSGILFDLSATTNVLVTHMTTAASAAANTAFTFEVYTRTGSALGGPVGSGPGSSPAGWTSLGIASATQGATSGGVSLLIDIPDINVGPGGVTGIALRWISGGGPRYFGTGSPPLENYSDGTLSLTTGDARSMIFTTGGTWFSSRALVGSLTYQVVPAPGAAAMLAVAGLAGARRRR